MNPFGRPYRAVAHEYYDRRRHPNSAALREYSRLALSELLKDIQQPAKAIEIGVGRPLLDQLAPWHHSFLIGLDDAPEMLAYARGLVDAVVLADARQLPIADSTVELVVASLADPYNERSFWSEAARILRPAGHIIVTTPTLEWASSVRQPCARSSTRFSTQQGTVVAPSYVHTKQSQVKLCRSAGLDIDAVIEIAAQPAPYDWLAPELDSRAADFPVVLGVRAVKTTNRVLKNSSQGAG